uniref:CONSTANS n=1 Tax=Gongylonema pulchrum TaxID=637853 RepID=A0A183DEH7_9BILA
LELPAQKVLYVNEKVEEQKLGANDVAASPEINGAAAAGDANMMNGIAVPQTFSSTDSSYDTSYIDQHFNKAYMDGDYSFVSTTSLRLITI